MSKGFGRSATASPGLAPAIAINGSAGANPLGQRPAGMGGVEVERAPQQGGFFANQFGPQGSDTRYNMAMDLIKGAMSGAQGSGSPALAFLAPIIGSAIGAKVSNQRDKYVASEQNKMAEDLLGSPLNPQAQQAMEVLNNPDAPAHLKAIAAAMFKQSTVPVGQMARPATRSGGGARRSGGNSAPAKLTYISRDPDGVVRGYNSRTGKREPVLNSDAAPAAVTAPVPAAAPAAAAPVQPQTPAPPPDPVIPRDPAGMTDDELLNRY